MRTNPIASAFITAAACAMFAASCARSTASQPSATAQIKEYEDAGAVGGKMENPAERFISK